MSVRVGSCRDRRGYLAGRVHSCRIFFRVVRSRVPQTPTVFNLQVMSLCLGGRTASMLIGNRVLRGFNMVLPGF